MELLKIIISWPFVVLILVGSFGWSFKEEIRQFLRKVGTIKLPRGTEILTTQSPPAKSEKKDDIAPPEPDPSVLTLNAEQQAVIRAHIESLSQQASTAEQEKEQILKNATDLLLQKEREVKYWWFMYLNLFLVPTTKHVLRWFASQPIAITKDYYNEVWKGIVANAVQREIMLMVLIHHNLIEANGPTLVLTQNGRDFLTFLAAAENLPSS